MRYSFIMFHFQLLFYTKLSHNLKVVILGEKGIYPTRNNINSMHKYKDKGGCFRLIFYPFLLLLPLLFLDDNLRTAHIMIGFILLKIKLNTSLKITIQYFSLYFKFYNEIDQQKFLCKLMQNEEETLNSYFTQTTSLLICRLHIWCSLIITKQTSESSNSSCIHRHTQLYI